MTGHPLKLILMATLVGVLVTACESEDLTKEDLMQSSSKSTPLAPPVTRIENVVDTHWGVQVEDPYRWLEDAASADVKAWTGQQTQRTRAYLDALPYRYGAVFGIFGVAAESWICLRVGSGQVLVV